MELLVLTQNNCRYCKLAKQFLDSEEVDYKEVNVSNNPEYVETYNLMSAPTILLLDDGEEIVRSTGFDQGELQELIDQL